MKYIQLGDVHAHGYKSFKLYNRVPAERFFLKDHDAFDRFSAICTREKTFVTFFSAHPVPSE